MDVPDSLDVLLYVPALVWLGLASFFVAMMAVDIGRRDVTRPPAAPWKLAAGFLLANVGIAMVVSGWLGEVSWQVFAFGIGIGVVGGGLLALLSGRRRVALAVARKAMRG